MKLYGFFVSLLILLSANEFVIGGAKAEETAFLCKPNEFAGGSKEPSFLDKTNTAWNKSKLQESLTLIRKYQNYVDREFVSQTKELVERQRVSLDKLNNCLDYLFDRLQVDSDKIYSVNTDFQQNQSAESKLANRTNNLQEIADLLIEIVERLNRVGLKQKRAWLLNQSRGYAIKILKSVDELVVQSSLYMPTTKEPDKQNNFLETRYKSISGSELKYYLSSQRQRVQHIANNYAQPAVTYLLNTKKINNNEMSSVKRWIANLKQINDYQQNKTGNSIAKLELLFTQLLAVGSEPDCSQFSKKQYSSAEIDLFSKVSANLFSQYFEYCTR